LAALDADENFRMPVVEALRRLGHDVLTSREAGRSGHGVPDEDVLSDALALRRTVLTQNRKHFIRLDRAGLDHCGWFMSGSCGDRSASHHRGCVVDSATTANSLGNKARNSIRVRCWYTARQGQGTRSSVNPPPG
jgi:Domain of unknown function (DUF5615)